MFTKDVNTQDRKCRDLIPTVQGGIKLWQFVLSIHYYSGHRQNLVLEQVTRTRTYSIVMNVLLWSQGIFIYLEIFLGLISSTSGGLRLGSLL